MKYDQYIKRIKHVQTPRVKKQLQLLFKRKVSPNVTADKGRAIFPRSCGDDANSHVLRSTQMNKHIRMRHSFA